MAPDDADRERRTPRGTTVGVADPYEHGGVCDFCTGEGRCRYAREHAGHDPPFAADRRADDYRCPAADPDGAWAWRDCPHYRSTASDRECARCGLAERRDAHSDARPLLEEHHLAYPDEAAGHEITVVLCRWCHAKVHGSWAKITDDVGPDPEALAAREQRRSDERRELDFSTAAERRDESDGP
ncbi:MAG: hypothetical protein ABEJ70_00985 [Halobacteriaceae archaeon]